MNDDPRDGSSFGALEVRRKTGAEPFVDGGRAAGFDLLEFWQWACSDLTNNALRGVIAEFIVAKALGAAQGTRVEWDAFDIRTPDGVRVEVKSAAYLQSWHQTKPSAIAFGIRSSSAFDAATNSYSSERRRQADVYVFCLLAHTHKPTLDPLALDQWTFYVLPTARLNAACPSQARISLASLRRLGPEKVTFAELASCVAAAGLEARAHGGGGETR